MADVHSPKTRSYNMSRIRSSDTKPEMIVRKFLHANSFRYRLHVKDLPGKPDLVLPKYKTVIFVHGCFWHAHEGCRYFKVPETNKTWWEEKHFGNRARDEKNVFLLEQMGWKVIIVWECELKKSNTESTLNTIMKEISMKK